MGMGTVIDHKQMVLRQRGVRNDLSVGGSGYRNVHAQRGIDRRLSMGGGIDSDNGNLREADIAYRLGVNRGIHDKHMVLR